MIWGRNDYRLYPVNPPLVKMIASVPLLLMEPVTDWQRFSPQYGLRSEWAVGEDFIAANGERSFRLFTVARLACIPFSLVGAITCFLWARDLYGSSAGLLAAAFWCLSPNILGNAALITPDVPAAALGVTAAYRLQAWMRTFSWRNALIAGMVLGLAELCKFTLLPLLILWPLLVVSVSFASPKQRDWTPLVFTAASQLATMLSVAILVINVGYGFQGTLRPLGSLPFISTKLAGDRADDATPANRYLKTMWKNCPVPLPESYIAGIDIQQHDFEHGKWSFLAGNVKHGGWWYYYLYALAIKVPVGFWILTAWATTHAYHTRRSSRNQWIAQALLLAHPVVLATIVSAHTGFSRYLRYMLPVFPFMHIWTSQVIRLWSCRMRVSGRRTIIMRRLLASSLIAWSIISGISVCPHNLSYFNELVGGPANGHHHLIDGNIDWGQDLLLLRRWIDKHPSARPLTIAYFGGFDPHAVNLNFPETPRRDCGEALMSNSIAPGWHAISVTLLHYPSGAYCYFRDRDPVARIGFSINIYSDDRAVTDQ